MSNTSGYYRVQKGLTTPNVVSNTLTVGPTTPVNQANSITTNGSNLNINTGIYTNNTTAVFQANGDVKIAGTVIAKSFKVDDGSNSTLPVEQITDKAVGCGVLTVITDHDYNWETWREDTIGDFSAHSEVRMEVKIYAPKGKEEHYLVMNGRDYDKLKAEKLPIHKGSIDTIRALYGCKF